jgi:hypothetical protein
MTIQKVADVDAEVKNRAQEAIYAMITGASIRQAARKYHLRERDIMDEIRAFLLERGPRRKSSCEYNRITIRLTERQRQLIFSEKNSPIGYPDERFHLTPEEASRLYGWANDELAEEDNATRRQALDNMLDKMRWAEKRASAGLDWRINK